MVEVVIIVNLGMPIPEELVSFGHKTSIFEVGGVSHFEDSGKPVIVNLDMQNYLKQDLISLK